MNRQNRTLFLLAILALVFVIIAGMVAMRTDAAEASELDRVSVVTEPEEAETAEAAQTPELPEQEAAAEHVGERTDVSDYSLPCVSHPLRRTRYLDGNNKGNETERIDGAAPVFPYTEQDVHDLAVAVYLEAGNASERAKLLVANVVINHVASPEFPDTIHGVLTVPYHYGTMAWDGVEFPADADPALVEECMQIARRILNGERLCPANVIGQAEFIQGTGIFEYIDGIYFCYY